MSAERDGRTYFCCSAGCRGRFERHAERVRMGELARMGALLADKKARWGIA